MKNEKARYLEWLKKQLGANCKKLITDGNTRAISCVEALNILLSSDSDNIEYKSLDGEHILTLRFSDSKNRGIEVKQYTDSDDGTTMLSVKGKVCEVTHYYPLYWWYFKPYLD